MHGESTIWVVEDDAICRDIVVSTLGDRWTLRTFDTLGALEQAAAERMDARLLVADVCLPDKNLVSWLASPQARAIVRDVPLLAISALDEVDVIRAAFEGGAFDFLSKPFGRAELRVKVERALERSPSGRPVNLPTPTAAHDLDVPAMLVRRMDGKSVGLTAKEMQIAAILWNAPHRTLAREVLQANIWQDCRVGRKTLAVHLSRLRRKLRVVGLDVVHTPPDHFVLCTTAEASSAPRSAVSRATSP